MFDVIVGAIIVVCCEYEREGERGVEVMVGWLVRTSLAWTRLSRSASEWAMRMSCAFMQD